MLQVLEQCSLYTCDQWQRDRMRRTQPETVAISASTSKGDNSTHLSASQVSSCTCMLHTSSPVQALPSCSYIWSGLPWSLLVMDLALWYALAVCIPQCNIVHDCTVLQSNSVHVYMIRPIMLTHIMTSIFILQNGSSHGSPKFNLSAGKDGASPEVALVPSYFGCLLCIVAWNQSGC